MSEPYDYRDVGEADDEEETEFATVADAPTVEEAKRKALDQLRKVVPLVDQRDVEYIVVEEGSKGGLFGRGKLLAQVEARLRPSSERVDDNAPAEAEALKEFVQTVVDLMGIHADVSVSETGDVVRADVAGDDLGLLIGRHGSTIDALQCIAGIAVNGDRRDRRQVVIDAEGYRGRRESALTALADRTAQKVAREGTSVTLQPMSAAERKVIHLHLKDDARVETSSEGNEPFRAVVISRRTTG
jgi:spoIIIJ-associated protein